MRPLTFFQSATAILLASMLVASCASATGQTPTTTSSSVQSKVGDDVDAKKVGDDVDSKKVGDDVDAKKVGD